MNIFSVDVEDYYSVFARDRLGIDGPPTQAVVRNTHRIVELLGGFGVKATFFILGEVASEFPQLIRDIAAAGHEIGVHGYYHRQVFKLTGEQFAREVGDARKLLQDISAQPAVGHRAPAFSITPETRWALEILAEQGFEYDSSIFPFAGRRYGWPSFGPDIRRVELPSGRSIIEIPMSTVRVLGRTLPACGGGYVRHFPYCVTRWALGKVQAARPAVVYMHPYEIDTDAPPADFAAALSKAAPPIRRFHRIQIRNRQTVYAKLSRMLEQFKFAPAKDVVAKMANAQ